MTIWATRVGRLGDSNWMFERQTLRRLANKNEALRLEQPQRRGSCVSDYQYLVASGRIWARFIDAPTPTAMTTASLKSTPRKKNPCRPNGHLKIFVAQTSVARTSVHRTQSVCKLLYMLWVNVIPHLHDEAGSASWLDEQLAWRASSTS